MKQAGLEAVSLDTFGELLRHARRRARLTQRELGIAVGYSESYVTRLEGGQRHPDPCTVRARFVDALRLRDAPELARRLVELADRAHSASRAASRAAPRAAPPSNLPAPLTRFIGREREMAGVARLLASTRLLTLTGSGGCGKTRLALETGRAMLAECADGVWLAELAPLDSPAPLTQTVAAAFGLQTMSRPAQAVLTNHLRDQCALLILDNCEHLVGACADLAAALLSACPNLRILATSREALSVPGEVAWRVPPMAIDEAVRLFEDRAAAARPGFAVTPANAGAVAGICQRLDDMPLAIELAAARVRAFTVEQIAARLDGAFRLLTGGSRVALPRQRTLHAAIDWSYNLLTGQERALLRGLSAFAGGWTLEAAEAVCGAGVVDLLDQLVGKSLVVVDETAAGLRYRLLETVRQFAEEAARAVDAADGEYDRMRQRHLAYYADLAQAGRLNAEDGTWYWIWNAELAAELDNTRAAMRWAAPSGCCRPGCQQPAWRLLMGVLGVWTVLGFGDELARWMETLVLADPEAGGAAHAGALTAIGRLYLAKGDIRRSLGIYRAASELAHRLGDEPLILEADEHLGFLTPGYEQAARLLAGVVRLAHRSRRKCHESLALCRLGTRMRIQGDLRQAYVAHAESVRVARETGHPGAIAGALGPMGQLLLELGDLDKAQAVLEESIALNRQLGLHGWLGYDLENLAEVGLGQRNGALVRMALNQTLPYYHRIDDLERVARGLATAAGLAHQQARLPQAARLLSAAETIRREHHTQGIFERELFAGYDRRLPEVRAALPPADFAAAWLEGQRLTLRQAIDEALAV